MLAVVLFIATVIGTSVVWLTARASWNAQLAGYEHAVTEARANAAASRDASMASHADATERLEALVVEAWVLYGASSGTETQDPRFDLLLAVRDAEAAVRLPPTLTTESIQVEGVEARWPLRDSRPSVVVEVVTGVEPAPAYLADVGERLRVAMDAVAPGAGG